MKRNSCKAPVWQPRFRVWRGRDIALGPGKVELLGHIADTHSISEAAWRMGMSYMRAWTLVQTMNGCFCEPLVTAKRGGKERGGACLTDTGHKVVDLYRRMEEQSRVAARTTWRQLRGLLKD